MVPRLMVVTRTDLLWDLLADGAWKAIEWRVASFGKFEGNARENNGHMVATGCFLPRR